MSVGCTHAPTLFVCTDGVRRPIMLPARGTEWAPIPPEVWCGYCGWVPAPTPSGGEQPEVPVERGNE